MGKLKSILWSLAVLVFAVPVCALAFFSLPFTGWKALTVQTGSMVPKIPVGTIVLVHKVPAQSLKVGDVITYQSLTKPISITHRIAHIKTSPLGRRQYITKGDANLAPDTLPVAERQIIGAVHYAIPGLGKAVDLSLITI